MLQSICTYLEYAYSQLVALWEAVIRVIKNILPYLGVHDAFTISGHDSYQTIYVTCCAYIAYKYAQHNTH